MYIANVLARERIVPVSVSVSVPGCDCDWFVCTSPYDNDPGGDSIPCVEPVLNLRPESLEPFQAVLIFLQIFFGSC